MPHRSDPPPSVDRPICSTCGWTMWFARSEPHDEPGHIKHIFECDRCDIEHLVVVKM